MIQQLIYHTQLLLLPSTGRRVVVNKLNKQPRTADKGWSFSLGVGRDANKPSP